MAAQFDMLNGLIQRLATPVAATDAANKAYADATAGGGIQKGLATLVNGTGTINTATITASSTVLVSRRNAPAAALGLLNTRAVTPGAPGSFIVEALSEAAGAVVATDTSEIDWVVIG